MATIAELTEHHLQNGTVDPYDLAARIIPEVNPEELVPLLAAHIGHIIRNRTRDNERAAFRATVASNETAVVVARPDTGPDFRLLAAERFAMGNGEKVQWLKATADDHRARIVYLSKMRDGIDDSIEQHRDALRIIETAGVNTLEEALALAPAAAA